MSRAPVARHVLEDSPWRRSRSVSSAAWPTSLPWRKSSTTGHSPGVRPCPRFGTRRRIGRGGHDLAIRELLLLQTTLLTPNTPEARCLAERDDEGELPPNVPVA